MPVWHEATRAARESGELVVVGIVQEQHPDRARLFAQWHGIDWPILWDPFNLTDARVVPIVAPLDEAGHRCVARLSPDELVDAYLGREPVPSPQLRPSGEELPQLTGLPADSPERAYWQAVADLLHRRADRMDDAVAAIEARVTAQPDDAPALFRLGVALRMRYDARGGAGDFQRAVDAWTGALALDPGQYIWRRRIQQFGPVLEKPYPFYPWVERAREEIAARGEEPIELRVPLTVSELSGRSPFAAAGSEPEEPDAERELPLDEGEWIEVATTVVPDSTGAPVARVHLELRPRNDVHWNNEAGPLTVWIGTGGLPEGVRVDTRLFEDAGRPVEVSSEVRRFELEVERDGDAATVLRGHVLFFACEDANGTCQYLRRDFEIPLGAP